MDRTDFIIADNQDVTKVGMRSFIVQTMKGAHLHEVSCKKELIASLSSADRAVVIIDYTLFDLNGIEDILILQKRFPEAGWLMFSSELSGDFMRRAAAEDSVSLLLKDCCAREIREALAVTAREGRYICRQVSHFLDSPDGKKEKVRENPLTSTEIEILKLIALGKSAKEIAAIRFLSNHTVITHKKNIFRKLGVNNVYEATKYALRAGLVEMMEYYI